MVLESFTTTMNLGMLSFESISAKNEARAASAGSIDQNLIMQRYSECLTTPVV